MFTCSTKCYSGTLFENQGLLNNMVSMTEKDSDGFMWFATWYGLCRFDGEKVLTYNHYQLDHDVPPRKIQYIIDDAKGFIWINTIDLNSIF